MDEYGLYGASVYDAQYSGLEDDIRFYVEEAQRSGEPVLELACGTGRILIPTARAGVRIVGLDRSHAMLERATRKLAAEEEQVGRRATLLDGDMRAFDLDERFQLITVPFRAFLHLLTVDDQMAALACIGRHLADDGRLILNVFDPRLDILVGSAAPAGSPLCRDAEFIHPETGRRTVAWYARSYDLDRQVVDVHYTYEELDDDGVTVARTHVPLVLRWIYRYEMEHLLGRCGYEVEALYGDFDRGPFRYGGEQIWLARKR